MKGKYPSTVLKVFLVVGVVVVSYFFYDLYQQIREVNFPDPSKYPVSEVLRYVNCQLLDVAVYAPLYIDRDTNSVIFLGKVRSAATKAKLKTDQKNLEKIYTKCYPDRTGVILTSSQGNREVWGFALSTTKGEWWQSSERFQSEFERLSQAP